MASSISKSYLLSRTSSDVVCMTSNSFIMFSMLESFNKFWFVNVVVKRSSPFSVMKSFFLIALLTILGFTRQRRLYILPGRSYTSSGCKTIYLSIIALKRRGERKESLDSDTFSANSSKTFSKLSIAFRPALSSYFNFLRKL